jgi:hypothetical protein
MKDCFLKSVIHDNRGRLCHVIESDCDSENFKRFNVEYRGRRVYFG